jgi:hypothetical protein
MNLTGKQLLLILSAVLSALVAASAQLTDIFGPTTAKAIISVVSLGNTVLTSITAALSGQGSLLKDVAAMPGIEKITVNAQANQTVAKEAVSEAQPKIEATPAALQTVAETAKG